MELMVVLVLISIIAGFALPNYRKAIRRAHERDAIAQLSLIYGANAIYFTKNSQYIPTGAGDIDYINTTLGLSVISNGMVYGYNRSAANRFTAASQWVDEGNSFTVRIDESFIQPGNPCCSNGVCPTLPNC